MSAEACDEHRRGRHGRARAPHAGAQPRARRDAVRTCRAVFRDLVRPHGRRIGMPAAPRHRRNGVTVLLLCAVVAGMVGLSLASVPLYRLFCQATGFGGTTQRAAAAPREIADAVITVRFDAETAPD